MTIGQNIKAAREAAGMTQAQLAGLAGTDRRMIGRYEDGSTDMSVVRLIDIAKALNVSPESLLEGV